MRGVCVCVCVCGMCARLIEAAKKAMDARGFGMSSVRFICGCQDIHKELEKAVSDYFGTEDTILYAACFDANGGVFEPLLTEEDAIISDALNHASIIDGVRLCKAVRYRYVKQLRGDVFDKIKELREKILYEIAFIESALDDPEHISLDGYTEKLSDQISYLMKELNKLLDSADDGKMLKEGIRTVIVGKPNVGKSSLLNLLVGQDRAIVTDIAGTTRDTLEETVNLGDFTLHMIDTAGIRNTEDVVEKIGVEKAKTISEDADLILYVMDSSLPLDENDADIVRLIKGKKTIILLNKSDLDEVVDKSSVEALFANVCGEDCSVYEVLEAGEEKQEDENICMIRISARKNDGLDLLVDLIKKMFFHGQISYEDEVCITSSRHKEALLEALESMKQVQVSLENNMPEDFYSIDLMNAYASLGRIIGEEVEDDLVNEIFSKFC